MTAIRDRAIKIIREQLSCHADHVVDSATFVALGADALDVYEIICAFEEEFTIEIFDNELKLASTVADAIGVVEKKVELKAVGGTGG